MSALPTSADFGAGPVPLLVPQPLADDCNVTPLGFARTALDAAHQLHVTLEPLTPDMRQMVLAHACSTLGINAGDIAREVQARTSARAGR